MSIDLEALGLSIKQAQYRHHRMLDAALRALGVSLVQWNALREIDRNPGSSLHRLAELTFNSDQAFGTLANRLLRRGLVERRSGPGRSIVLELSSRGQKLRQQGRRLVLDVIAKSFARFDERERGTLQRLLVKLLEADGA